MKASDLFVKCLENEGVTYVFGVPGEENEDLLFSLEDSSIQFIPTRHEQGAAFMADLWGRLTGKAGVCLSTLGPGATNLMTGVADANMDKSPVVAVTGQAGLDRIYKESHQYLNIVDMFRSITKWSTSISRPESVPEIVRKAFKIAEDEKPGAAHIELPEDVAGMEIEGEPMRPVTVRRPDPDKAAIRDAVSLLKAASKPLIIAGNGAVRKMAWKDLADLVTRCHIPVAHTFMGQGAVSDMWPESLLTLGLPFRDFIMEAVEQADLVISVGVEPSEYPPKAWNPRRDKKIIHIDFTPAEVDSYYQPEVEIVADIGVTLRELAQKLAFTAFDLSWAKPTREKILSDIRSYDLREGKPFTIPGVLNVLRSIMEDSDLLISDVGAHKFWIARNYLSCCPNACIFSNGLSSMGIALPGAIAAALHSPERAIVAAMGDGGFLMNSQELETAKRLGVGFTVLIFNDNDYGLISWKQRMRRGRSTGTRLTNPDFKAYAESFGIRGFRPESVSELQSQLREAVASRELCVLEVPVDAAVNDELVRKLGAPQTAQETRIHLLR